MFANKAAIETLIRTDSSATKNEKEHALIAINGVATRPVVSQVWSIQDAAKYLGRPRKSIYNLLRNGTLKGFYSGKKHIRATGVTKDSLEAAVNQIRNYK